ncbi:unnamed protein product [Arctogadus glacialis]
MGDGFQRDLAAVISGVLTAAMWPRSSSAPQAADSHCEGRPTSPAPDLLTPAQGGQPNPLHPPASASQPLGEQAEAFMPAPLADPLTEPWGGAGLWTSGG